MKHRIFVILILLVLVSIHLWLPPRAEAYLDPGTGSYILQILIAGLMSALFIIKPILRRIKLFIAKLFGKVTGGHTEDFDE